MAQHTILPPGANPDRFRSLDEVQRAMRQVGLESSNLIFGIDFTKSNTWTGERTFRNQCLHAILPNQFNPYQQAMDICGRTLDPFDDDGLIPCFGFGDAGTTDKGVFPFNPDGSPCIRIQGVLRRYCEIVQNVRMSGPTSFEPIIRKAMEIVGQTRQYHILVIICDGEVNSVVPTRDAIIAASQYPLSIVCVGVGDGPFGVLEHFDDQLTQSKFDNFQFVNFYQIMSNPRVENYDVEFACKALNEIPDQFLACRRLGYI